MIDYIEVNLTATPETDEEGSISLGVYTLAHLPRVGDSLLLEVEALEQEFSLETRVDEVMLVGHRKDERRMPEQPYVSVTIRTSSCEEFEALLGALRVEQQAHETRGVSIVHLIGSVNAHGGPEDGTITFNDTPAAHVFQGTHIQAALDSIFEETVEVGANGHNGG